MRTRRNNTKRTDTYKRIRLLFRKHFIPPHFTDYIKDGVSFKWYDNWVVKDLLKNKGFSEYFRENFPGDIYKLLTFKILPNKQSRPESTIFRNQYEFNSLRILVKLRGLK